MEASKVTKLLFDTLNFRAERQKVLTSNVANINTPKYKTKDLRFEQELSKVNEPILQMSRTTNSHFTNIKVENKSKNFQVVQVEGLQEQNDGNNVNLDSQMGEMSKNKIMFDALQEVIKKDSRLLRSVLDASAKN